jgi:hypothetical protein
MDMKKILKQSKAKELLQNTSQVHKRKMFINFHTPCIGLGHFKHMMRKT